MTLFERVKEISKKHGFSSLRVLSEQAGISPNVIYGWKTKEPSAKSLQAVADTLGVSVDYLLGSTDEMHTPTKASPIDLVNAVDDSERDRLISANGQPISDEDWAIIKAVLAKYPKRD